MSFKDQELFTHLLCWHFWILLKCFQDFLFALNRAWETHPTSPAQNMDHRPFLQSNWASICHVPPPYHSSWEGNPMSWLTYANQNYPRGCGHFFLSHMRERCLLNKTGFCKEERDRESKRERKTLKWIKQNTVYLSSGILLDNKKEWKHWCMLKHRWTVKPSW